MPELAISVPKRLCRSRERFEERPELAQASRFSIRRRAFEPCLDVHDQKDSVPRTLTGIVRKL